MRVIVSAGGTGGHIYPALAIINKIKEHNKDAEFLYIGTTTRMEKDIIPEHGIDYIGLDTYGLQRKLSLRNIKAVIKYLEAIKKSKKIIKEFKPDIVIGCGGYVMAPVIYAAKKCGCKTLIHEQNSVLGLSNKIMLKYTDTLCTSFKSMKVDKVNSIQSKESTIEKNEPKAKPTVKEDVKEEVAAKPKKKKKVSDVHEEQISIFDLM